MIPSSLYPLVTALLSNVLAQVGKRSYIIIELANGIYTGSSQVAAFQAVTHQP